METSRKDQQSLELTLVRKNIFAKNYQFIAYCCYCLHYSNGIEQRCHIREVIATKKTKRSEKRKKTGVDTWFVFLDLFVFFDLISPFGFFLCFVFSLFEL